MIFLKRDLINFMGSKKVPITDSRRKTCSFLDHLRGNDVSRHLFELFCLSPVARKYR